MNISALRHDAHKDDSESDELDSEEYDVAPWSKSVVERYSPPSSTSHMYIQENKGVPSRLVDVFPTVSHNEGGSGGRKKELFADNPIGVPEMPDDISDAEDDFLAKNFPHILRPPTPPSRDESPISPASAPGSSSLLTPHSSTYRLRSASDATFGDIHRSRALSHKPSNNTYQYMPRHNLETVGYHSYNQETTSQYRYRPDDPPWNRNQNFHEDDDDDDALAESMARRYLSASVFSESSSLPSHETSAKARGKRKQHNDSDARRQMSQLQLETSSRGSHVGRGPNSAHERDHGESPLSAASSTDKNPSSSRRQPPLQRRATISSVRSSHCEPRTTGNSSLSPVGSKRFVDSDSEDDGEWDPSDDHKSGGGGGGSSKYKRRKVKVNRYPCPLCNDTFTRRNDVRRHLKNAAVHRDQPEALAILGEAVGDTGTRCKYCGTDLSRSDARMRHERASACGKRTTQKMKESISTRT
ncbi:hypothetical protein D9758_006870 [Tetrapyrgos nigripes]|uniref:C2H2-type domain-containing protein n=1 Tax=Tetrapyrgos nigripes TaxID=182062 RepID=A0A8H5CV87_9AGAR|nr:hypothetical protein D9758_006870 [Tetrapyrgos nigripes]